MSETALLWVLGVLVMCLAALAGLMWRHVEHCKEVHSRLAEIGADVKRIQHDIGDHGSGMRGDLHRYGKALFYQGGCIWMIAEKTGVELPPSPEK